MVAANVTRPPGPAKAAASAQSCGVGSAGIA